MSASSALLLTKFFVHHVEQVVCMSWAPSAGGLPCLFLAGGDQKLELI